MVSKVLGGSSAGALELRGDCTVTWEAAGWPAWRIYSLFFLFRSFRRLTTSCKLTRRRSALKTGPNMTSPQGTATLSKFPRERESWSVSRELQFLNIHFIHSAKPRGMNSRPLSHGLAALASLWTNTTDMTLAIQIGVKFPPIHSHRQWFCWNVWEFCRKFLTNMKVFGKCLRKQTTKWESPPHWTYISHLWRNCKSSC